MLVVILAFGLYAFFSGGPGILQWLYPNELFPTEVRASAVGIAIGVLAHRHHRGHVRHAAVPGCVRRWPHHARGGGPRDPGPGAVGVHGARDQGQVARGDERARRGERRARAGRRGGAAHGPHPGPQARRKRPPGWPGLSARPHPGRPATPGPPGPQLARPGSRRTRPTPRLARPAPSGSPAPRLASTLRLARTPACQHPPARQHPRLASTPGSAARPRPARPAPPARPHLRLARTPVSPAPLPGSHRTSDPPLTPWLVPHPCPMGAGLPGSQVPAPFFASNGRSKSRFGNLQDGPDASLRLPGREKPGRRFPSEFGKAF